MYGTRTPPSSRTPSARLRRRKKKNKAPESETTSIHDVPDKILKLVLLRLDSSACLVRAAATCKRWRGIIASKDGGGFLRLARAIHRPAIVGHYHIGSEPTEFVPSSSSSSSSSSSTPASFSPSLDFLPANARRWDVADCHGGLVLLRQPDPVVFPDLVVCDPVSRKHQGITHPQVQPGYSFADASLLDGEEDGGGVSMSSFRILYRFYMGPRACVFTTAEGGDWRELDAAGDDVDDGLDHFTMAHVAGRLFDGAGGSRLCMGLMQSGRAIVLDNSTLEFSHIDLPTGIDIVKEQEEEDEEEEEAGYSNFRVVHSYGDDPNKQAATRIVHVRGQEQLEVFRQVTSSDQWVLEHSIRRLSEACRGLPGYPTKKRFHWVVEAVANAAGFVVLSVMDGGRRWLFSVNVETMAMATVPERTFRSATSPYTMPWPPVIAACVGQSRRRRRR